ncbi:MAG: hypothetical protein JW884_04155 [Deltaproteobacteria bacterium]|nr:hypothetical protein [Deltaproteobacteria bacterium]
MQTVAAASSGTTEQSRAGTCRTVPKPRLVKRFQHFIESTDWDERYLGAAWVDRACIVVTILCCLPFLMRIWMQKIP